VVGDRVTIFDGIHEIANDGLQPLNAPLKVSRF
jgi:hypothetical protein